jgi:hypothetical protein
MEGHAGTEHEVADIFHRHGAARRATDACHLSLGQLKVMSAIQNCRRSPAAISRQRCFCDETTIPAT